MESEELVVLNSKSINELAFKLFGCSNGNNWVKAREISLKYNKVFKVKVNKYCLYCDKELNEDQSKFCSLSCSNSFNNKNRGLSDETKEEICKFLTKNSVSRKHDNFDKLVVRNMVKEKKYCLKCNRELSGAQKKFCSSKCSSEYRYDENIISWKNGDLVNHSGNLNSFIRTYLLKKHNFKCEKCGFSGFNPISNKSVLQIHHKNGDSTDNKEENLQVLCPNCHSETPTYMGLNRGNSKRNTRYKENNGE